MRHLQIIVLCIVLAALQACHTGNSVQPEKTAPDSSRTLEGSTDPLEHSTGKFPPVSHLKDYRETVFLPTMEHTLPKGKNAVYCASLLLAWDEIRQLLPQPVKIDSSHRSLTLFNRSSSFKEVLKEGEYKTNVAVNGILVEARAELNKTLAFQCELEELTNQLTFSGQKVAAFGQFGMEYCDGEGIEILHYENNEDFIIQIATTDPMHKIILCMTPLAHATIADALHLMYKRISQGKKERKIEKRRWRYSLLDIDKVVIPTFRFNIENNYDELEERDFFAGQEPFRLVKAYQRTAFMLNKDGAELESYAEAEAAAAAAPEDEEVEKETPKAKHLVFDKPFYIMLQRTDSGNPYLAIRVENTELMVPER
jgi:hypothetical protein